MSGNTILVSHNLIRLLLELVYYIFYKKRTLKQFSDFCLTRFKQSDESIISELLKQKPSDMAINACDLLQQWINLVSKRLSPSTIKVYLSHIKQYFNYRGIKLTSQDMVSLNTPREAIEEKYRRNLGPSPHPWARFRDFPVAFSAPWQKKFYLD